MNKTKKGIVVCLLAVALLVSMVGMASANTTTWDLDSENLAAGVYEMERQGGSGDDGQSGWVNLSAAQTVIWRADEAALVNLSWQNTEWSGAFKTTSTATDYTVEIGYMTGTNPSNFVSKGSGTYTYYEGSNNLNHWGINANAFNHSKDEYLAFKLTTVASGMNISCAENSWVLYPPEEPKYPVPELPTIILMSAGLLALAGFVLYSRRRNNK